MFETISAMASQRELFGYSAQGAARGRNHQSYSGEAPSDIGVQAAVPANCMADWQKLDYWGIPQSLLPGRLCKVLVPADISMGRTICGHL